MPRIKPLSNTKRAISELREKIFSGTLAPGRDYLEADLANQLNMSRTPIREAVLTLVSQGLMEMRPRKGARVLPVSAQDMAEIYDVLIELESSAAEQAARAKHSQKRLATIAHAIDDMEKALQVNDRTSWSIADERFHTELVNLAGNSRIIAIVAMMSDQVRQARMTTLYARPLPIASNDAHRTVYQAICDGHPEVARATHRDHRREAKEIIIELLKQQDQPDP